MNWDSFNRVAKYQDFNTEAEAQAHIVGNQAAYPDAFAVSKPNDEFQSWLIDPATKNVSISFPVVIKPTDEERIDAAFPQTDVARVIFEAFFEVANRLQALEGKSPITRDQLKTWLKSKLPQA